MESPQDARPIFAGEFRHAMDAKNRVTIPSRWRRDDIDEFFAIPNLEGGFLMMMPPGEFKRVADKVDQDERISAGDRQKFIRHLSSRAQHVTSDKLGRMVLPDEYCKQLSLRGEVVLVGNYLRFEVWSPEAWRRTREQDATAFRFLSEKVGI